MPTFDMTRFVAGLPKVEPHLHLAEIDRHALGAAARAT
jgi:hypothetical protein